MGAAAGCRVAISGEHEEGLTAGGAVGDLDAGAANSGDGVTTVAGKFEGCGRVSSSGAEELCPGLCQFFADGAHENRARVNEEDQWSLRQKLPVQEIFPESWFGGKWEIGIFLRKVGISQSESVC